MDAKLNDSISTTILEGLKYIQDISKHLPEDLTEKTHSVTSSFQKLLRVLDHAKRICVPELNRNYINRRNIRTSLSNEQVDRDYKVDERKSINIPPYTTTEDYLVIQEDSSSNSHAPFIRLNITVNNKLKGMYYCLIENGHLLLDRNINAEHSEYVISLSEYTFKAVNNFTIKFTNNELQLALLFGYKIDCTTWMEYLTVATESVYSYVTINRCNVLKSLSPKVKPTEYPPIMKSRSVDIILQPDSDIIDLSSLSLEISRKAYERKSESSLPINNVTAPLPIPPTNHPSGPKEKVTPKGGVKRFRRFLPLKQVKTTPYIGRTNVMPQKPLPYQNRIHNT